jgi:cellulose synthase/poly-beta-1,6-N-acetylglucosamine synthase-like glycosyltransferase
MNLFFLIILSILGVSFLVTIFFVLYRAVSIKKFKVKYQNEVDESYNPKTVIIFPVKGASHNLEKNLKAIMSQNYKGNYDVIFSVESKEDPAYDVINNFIKDYDNASIVVSGKATHSAQKNHNVIKAMENSPDDVEVYAFCDADHKTEPDWLSTLIRTLSLPDIEVATFFRENTPKSDTLGNKIYTILINGMYYFHTLINNVWGGAFAIKKETIKKYDIDKAWQRKTSHDNAVTESGVKVVCNPFYTVKDDQVDSSVKEMAKWYQRQMTNLKYTMTGVWLGGVSMIIVQVIAVIMLPLLVILTITNINYIYYLIPLVIYILYALYFVGYLMAKRNIDKHPITYGYYMFLFFSVVAYAFITSIFKRNIVWAGKRYNFDNEGKIESIEEVEEVEAKK